MRAGVSAVLSNGRLVDLDSAEALAPEDFSLLDLHASRQQLAGVLEGVLTPDDDKDGGSEQGGGKLDAGELSDVISAASSVLAANLPEEVSPTCCACFLSTSPPGGGLLWEGCVLSCA